MTVQDEEDFMGFLGVVYIIGFIVTLFLKLSGLIVLRWAAVIMYPAIACYAIIIILLLFSIIVKIIWR